MKKLIGLISVVVIVVIAVIVMNNLVYYKYYDYDIATMQYEDVTIGARLLGRFQEGGATTTLTGPYDLLLWFNGGEQYSKVDIRKLELAKKTDGDIVFAQNTVQTSRCIPTSENNVYSADFKYESLNIDYLDYELHIEFEMEDKQGNVKSGELIIPIERDYKEKTSLYFWDRMMSV